MIFYKLTVLIETTFKNMEKITEGVKKVLDSSQIVRDLVRELSEELFLKKKVVQKIQCKLSPDNYDFVYQDNLAFNLVKAQISLGYMIPLKAAPHGRSERPSCMSIAHRIRSKEKSLVNVSLGKISHLRNSRENDCLIGDSAMAPLLMINQNLKGHISSEKIILKKSPIYRDQNQIKCRSIDNFD